MAFIGMFTIISATAQNNVGIGTTNPDPSAVLEANSTTQGFLPPRMTEAQRNAIAAPVAAGLVVWCSNCGADGELQVYNGTNWTNMVGGTALAAPLAIGDAHAGGIIFYLDGIGGGKVCSLIDLNFSVQIQWTTLPFHPITVPTSIAFPNGATSLTNGAANTDAIIAQAGPGNTYAAGLCRMYSAIGDGGLNDWYLPSESELNLIYFNIGPGNTTPGFGNVGGLSTSGHWSSTEASSSEGRVQNFGGGGWFSVPKPAQATVRAIRAF